MTIGPIIALQIDGKYFIVYFDASHSGMGVVLMQYKNFIAYVFVQLKVHERNYPNRDLALVAVVFSLKMLALRIVFRHNGLRVCSQMEESNFSEKVLTQFWSM